MSKRNIWLQRKMECDVAIGCARNLGTCLFVMAYVASWYALAGPFAWYCGLVEVYLMVAGVFAVFWSFGLMFDIERVRQKNILRWSEIRLLAHEGFCVTRDNRPWWLI